MALTGFIHRQPSLKRARRNISSGWKRNDRRRKRKRQTPIMIKLLALDLDGTLLNSEGKIPDANKQAIRAAEEKGVLVTIATGRRFRDARPVGLELELNAP